MTRPKGGGKILRMQSCFTSRKTWSRSTPSKRHLLNVLDPRYKLPGRKHFSEVVLPHLYNTTRAKVTKKLEDMQFFSATTDLWSSHTMEPYLSLTVHFITDKWSLENACLQTSFFPSDHIAHGVKDPSTDSASGICKKVVRSFSYSWKRRRELTAVQAELGLPVHQLITESPTRWGSRQAMIQRVLEQERAISRVLGSDKKCRYLLPTWQDVEVLEPVNKAVKPLQDLTDALSGESYVTVSFIKPTLSMFRSSLLKPEDEDTELTRKI
ncbi:hypothetical protein L3Q82_004415 [Scortum barcoo]|uniref:Uncharacterized protein n=1 Tax=Scortum barcoo TaxID=214431 RepID=A0ACB8VJR6_9TELE|nr:hypothetical protein L3Q82_004415 [Scortum barcoo]